MTSLDALATGLRKSRGLAHKRDVGAVMARLQSTSLPPGFDVAHLRNGDDCAAIADGEGWLLFAIEGFMNEFVAREPWFAGWCAVMVNLSDVYAMGGRPLAVVDALWSTDHEHAGAILDGMSAASRAYGVPIVGGHSNAHCDRGQLAVAVLGRAHALLTSFDARPGDVLIAAIDLRGAYRPHFSNWDAASTAPPARLRGDLELLPRLAEDGLCRAAKDVSQAGVLGTLLMLLECSGVGAVIEPAAMPKPAATNRERWLLETFPSFGFLLAVPPANVDEVLARFQARGIASAAIGHCDSSAGLRLREASEEQVVWDFKLDRLFGFGAEAPTSSQNPREPAHA